ncbi:Rieske (2Fe-2S) protein [Catenulispora yoronensis]|uniref:Cytochrome bc1 complex Rieske iron-sulfur subunit n=1 Tax=Catenulispora yoronensis TaxID=450799 RepID=A0ABN2U570_9ACTN
MSEELEVEESGPDRRSLMKAAALVAVPVVGVGTVAACSSSKSGGSGPSTGAGATPVTVPSSSVPVGGGTVNAGVVVTQPQAGVYKAFSAVCTHQGCTVKEVANNQIHCPCHGSIFSAQDGSVVMGPATQPLAAMTATLSGADVTVSGAAKS